MYKLKCYMLSHNILKLRGRLLRWGLTVFHNVVGPMVKSFDNGENLTTALNLF